MKAGQYLELYCQRLGIANPPRMILTMKEYRHWIREILGWRRMPRIKYNLGRCFRSENTIWVNAKRHRTKVQLRHTIAHELIHMKLSGLNHGARFDELTQAVISDTLASHSRVIQPIRPAVQEPVPIVVKYPAKCRLCGKEILRLKAHLRRKHKRIRYQRFSEKTLSRYYRNPAQGT